MWKISSDSVVNDSHGKQQLGCIRNGGHFDASRAVFVISEGFVVVSMAYICFVIRCIALTAFRYGCHSCKTSLWSNKGPNRCHVPKRAAGAHSGPPRCAALTAAVPLHTGGNFLFIHGALGPEVVNLEQHP